MSVEFFPLLKFIQKLLFFAEMKYCSNLIFFQLSRFSKIRFQMFWTFGTNGKKEGKPTTSFLESQLLHIYWYLKPQLIITSSSNERISNRVDSICFKNWKVVASASHIWNNIFCYFWIKHIFEISIHPYVCTVFPSL